MSWLMLWRIDATCIISNDLISLSKYINKLTYTCIQSVCEKVCFGFSAHKTSYSSCILFKSASCSYSSHWRGGRRCNIFLLTAVSTFKSILNIRKCARSFFPKIFKQRNWVFVTNFSNSYIFASKCHKP